MRPGMIVSPEASMTSCEAGQGPREPVAMLSIRPSLTTTVASRTGEGPGPSVSVAPRRPVMALREREAVEPRGVLADHLAPHVRGQVAELAVDVLPGVRPDAVG